MKCEYCQHWIVRRETIYGNGDLIVNWSAPDGKGACGSLGIETEAGFGCNRFMEDDFDHVETAQKEGAPWQNFTIIDCPECGGKGDGSRGHRCAGTGKVRLYDDGYICDEQTRVHPKEIPGPSSCPQCSIPVDRSWMHCPACGERLFKPVAETEIISDAEAGLGPTPPESE